MKSKVTVIIPTHERHHLLTRGIEYYKNWNAKIIIVDSSNNEFKTIFPENFLYLHCPLMNFGDKLINALSKATSSYVALCADDDFLAKNGVIQGIDFLDINPNYVSVQGNIISFYQANSRVFYRPGYSREGYKVFGESPLERIKEAFSPYMHQFYSLHRKINLEKCLEVTRGLNVITPVEMSTTLVSAVRGKHKILPIFWLARDNRLHTTYDLLVDSKTTQRKDKALNKDLSSVAVNDWESYLSSKQGLLFKQQFIDSMEFDNNHAAELFDLAFAMYLEGQKNKKKNYFTDFVMKLAKSIKQKIPSQLYKKISILYIFITYFKNRFSMRHLKGYPFSSKQAKNDWNMITIALTRK